MTLTLVPPLPPCPNGRHWMRRQVTGLWVCAWCPETRRFGAA